MAKKKPKDKKRSESVRFLCREGEKQRYERLADALDVSMSDWIRRTLNKEADAIEKQIGAERQPDG